MAGEALLSIKDIQNKWNISRQTIQTGIKKKELRGIKNKHSNKWEFELAEVIRWRGEPSTINQPALAPVAVKIEPDPEIVALLKQQLEEQKDNHQKQLQDKEKEIERLVVQIDRKDDQIKQSQMLLEDRNKSWFKKVFS